MSENSKEIVSDTKENSCKNCDTKFVGNYCPNCGQSKREYDKPFQFIIADFAGDLFAFDTRIWKTFKAILFRPGQVTDDFILGKRARYMPSFRLYVFSSFVFFLLLSYTSGFNDDNFKLEATGPNGEPTNISLFSDSVQVHEGDSNIVLDSLMDDKISIGSGTVLGERTFEFDDIRKNPDQYFDKFLKWISTSMFFLMPFYALLLWLFFRTSYPYYFGHLVLAINQHVFVFLVLTLVLLVKLIFPNTEFNPMALLLFWIPVYFTLGVKRVYQRKWSTLLFRLSVIWVVYLLVSITSIFVIGFFTMTRG